MTSLLTERGGDKTCFKCSRTLPRCEFYRHPMMGDGLLGKCKDCTKRDVKERYDRLVATPEGLEAERRRGREKYHRLYGNGPNWTAPPASPQKKMRAHNMVIRAVKAGQIYRPTECEDCGVTPERVHAHHEDYDQPLSVVWVCPTCHRRRHAVHPERVKPSPGRTEGTRDVA